MQTPQFSGTCSICGGRGVSSGRGMSASWQGAPLTHSNPKICILNLEAKRLAREKLAEDQAAQERAKFDADDEYMFEMWDEVNGH